MRRGRADRERRQLSFAEAITNSAHLTQALIADEPGRLVRVRGGGIGPGLPGSLGAQLARPDRKVVGIVRTARRCTRSRRCGRPRIIGSPSPMSC